MKGKTMKNHVFGSSLAICLLTVMSAFIFIITPTPAASTDPNQKSTTSSEQLIWGQPVNGLRAAVEFIPEMESYMLGRQVSIRFHIQNVSDHLIEFTTGTWRCVDTQCIVADANGNMISSPPSAWYSGLIPTERKRLSPGQTTTIESPSLGFAKEGQMQSGFNHPVGPVARLRPGKYSLWYKLNFSDLTTDPGLVELDDWKGTLETGKRLINVFAADANYPSAAEIARSKGIWLDTEGAFIDNANQDQREREKCLSAVMELIAPFWSSGTRQELEKYFIMDGGKQTLFDERYYYSGCPYIKVRVKFQSADPNSSLESKNDKITKMALPYFEEPRSD
jgi:hypothetical protein